MILDLNTSVRNVIENPGIDKLFTTVTRTLVSDHDDVNYK